MPRPCTCDSFHPGEYRPGDCRRCWLAAHDPRYRRKWGVTEDVKGVPGPKPKAVPLPCIHEGRNVPPPEGESPKRSYLRCEAGLGVVCRCDCNSRCRLYEAEIDPKT